MVPDNLMTLCTPEIPAWNTLILVPVRVSCQSLRSTGKFTYDKHR